MASAAVLTRCQHQQRQRLQARWPSARASLTIRSRDACKAGGSAYTGRRLLWWRSIPMRGKALSIPGTEWGSRGFREGENARIPIAGSIAMVPEMWPSLWSRMGAGFWQMSPWQWRHRITRLAQTGEVTGGIWHCGYHGHIRINVAESLKVNACSWGSSVTVILKCHAVKLTTCTRIAV